MSQPNKQGARLPDVNSSGPWYSMFCECGYSTDLHVDGVERDEMVEHLVRDHGVNPDVAHEQASLNL